MMNRQLLVLLLIFFANLCDGQINAYARITVIAGNSLTTANVYQTPHLFVVGENVVVMQMQDNVIGGNTSENVSFGNLSAIANAGRYEIRKIISINGTSTLGFSSATPGNIVVEPLVYSYNTGANNRVQIISFRRMGTPNFTTSSNIVALPWDGNVGGVIAMEVPGILTLNHNITANAVGFRGGMVSNNNGGSNCQAGPYRTADADYGEKGEGIFLRSATLYQYGRAKILNGGGGGGDHNAGGGGGGNYTAGGDGGGGWAGGGNCAANLGYGYGGISLSGQISGGRIFMGGGGGGGGQINNSVGSNGANGGGIIILKAGTITTSSCTNRIISVNGGTAGNAGNDGAGGGGAAGTIVFNVTTWAINAACPLQVQANGGTGGSVINGGVHGGGGGGAQGAVIYTNAQPTTNITTNTLNGTAGCNNNSNPCNNFAGSPSGAPNSGIFSTPSTPLPVSLLSFDVQLASSRKVDISWATSSEQNNDFFTVEKSNDGMIWVEVTIVKGYGNSTSLQEYTAIDWNPSINLSYYRLKQTDIDGKFTYSAIRSIDIQSEQVTLYPNPANQTLNVLGKDIKFENVSITDVTGKDVKSKVEVLLESNGQIHLNIENLESGTYFIRANGDILRFVKSSK